MEENNTSKNANDPAKVDDPQVDVRSELNSLMTTVKTRVKDAILIAIESLLIPRLEPAMNSVKASSGRDVDSVLPDPD